MEIVSVSQRTNMAFAWTGALLALAYGMHLGIAQSSYASGLSHAVAWCVAAIATLFALKIAETQRWLVRGLCFILGALFTGLSLTLTQLPFDKLILSLIRP